MVNLGKYITRIDYGRTEYECAYCYKTTTSLTALTQHCRDSRAHCWCNRCERVFPHNTALDDHLKYSSAHHICERGDCYEDFPISDELVDHKEECHNWCKPCNWFAESQYQLREHDINRHFMCGTCGIFFPNDNNRRMHMITHQERDRECYGCTRMFSTFSAMLIHLEAGRCCTSRDELKSIAAECMESDEYFRGFDEYFPFYCSNCDVEFSRLSGLYQHVEMRLECQNLLEDGSCLYDLEHHLNNELSD
ncbi:C2H2 finger domain-containing protein [Blastomyces dermatitidis ER-3]|uniref:C2H2 finger domain-containing protein n=2 Tax=Ajellomyces dermatitidis TaxID=5039 RepID=F2TK18_AJEDA|nr:C2H2 finger domain-containing protein [Blastomyces dermatitidis ER-3]EEQ90191.1 C2H2 finger domain-containing protein [Blastomyces dermatitidis ER-3]EGE83581.1 C2H2 finger domain-containing protein [Blastomyces dermatitidis ATCC 18188]EQL34673.1 hypothetical protein BDFG_03615 [Blastomyces dermatitidis ATCC 26199]